jgi:hypothetical protein
MKQKAHRKAHRMTLRECVGNDNPMINLVKADAVTLSILRPIVLQSVRIVEFRFHIVCVLEQARPW